MWLADEVITKDITAEGTFGANMARLVPADTTIASVEIDQYNADGNELTITNATVNTSEVSYERNDGRQYTARVGTYVSFHIAVPPAVGNYRIKIIATCADGTTTEPLTCRYVVVDGLTQV